MQIHAYWIINDHFHPNMHYHIQNITRLSCIIFCKEHPDRQSRCETPILLLLFPCSLKVAPSGPSVNAKPWLSHAPYKPWQPKLEATANQDNPKSSAKSLEAWQRSNLTLHDWLTVFAYTRRWKSMAGLKKKLWMKTQSQKWSWAKWFTCASRWSASPSSMGPLILHLISPGA